MNRLISANAVTWSRFSSWATFDATEAVRDWATDDRKNNGLKIKIQESFGVNIGSLFSQPDCTAHVGEHHLTGKGSTPPPFLFTPFRTYIGNDECS